MSKTIVIFRKYKEGDVIALFPEMKENDGLVNSYMHVGQHGGADYYGTVAITKLAKEDEYRDLHEELTSIGYHLTVRKRYIHRRKRRCPKVDKQNEA